MSRPIEPNRIPAGPIVEVIQSYLDSQGERLGASTYAPYPITLLAERADMNADTLMKTIEGRMQTIDFDVADRLLCVMNLTDLWLTDLREVYDEAQLVEGKRRIQPKSASGVKVCARRGCSTRFRPPKKCPRKRFCSDTCKSTAWKHEKGLLKTGRLRGKNRVLEALTCRNGHERTKENTGTNSRGTRYCLVCHRATSKRWRESQAAAA
jgi:hypothetical protein